MSSTIEEVIEKRQEAAAKNARAAAVRLSDGDSADLRSQLRHVDLLWGCLRNEEGENDLSVCEEFHVV